MRKIKLRTKMRRAKWNQSGKMWLLSWFCVEQRWTKL